MITTERIKTCFPWVDTYEDLRSFLDYNSQRDNKADPGIACFPTSAAIAMNAVLCGMLGPLQKPTLQNVGRELIHTYMKEAKGLSVDADQLETDDQMWALSNTDQVRLASGVPASVGAGKANQWACAIMFSMQYYYNEGFKAKLCAYTKPGIQRAINNTKVVIIGTTQFGGHMMCVLGYNDEGFVVYDPWNESQVLLKYDEYVKNSLFYIEVDMI